MNTWSQTYCSYTMHWTLKCISKLSFKNKKETCNPPMQLLPSSVSKNPSGHRHSNPPSRLTHSPNVHRPRSLTHSLISEKENASRSLHLFKYKNFGNTIKSVFSFSFFNFCLRPSDNLHNFYLNLIQSVTAKTLTVFCILTTTMSIGSCFVTFFVRDINYNVVRAVSHKLSQGLSEAPFCIMRV